jgi:DNA-binding NtrC family response regulator
MSDTHRKADQRTRILLVDDNPVNLQVLSDAIEPQGFEVLAARDSHLALNIAQRALPDLILLDVVMPQMDGFEVCRRLKKNDLTRDIPVIFLTAKSEVDSVTQGFRAGGVDYITKPFQTEEVVIRISTHVRNRQLTVELTAKNRTLEQRTAELTEANERLRQEVTRREQAEDALQTADEKLHLMRDREVARWGVAGFIGKSKTVAKILADVEKLHQFGTTGVLITGESGTGKELIARAIHFGGPRAKEPFIPINCVAVPGELAESMLFGHLRGSFTGAISDRKGVFELAHGGTLFLDEIGGMPLSLQAKLLRVLEDRIITPLGAASGRTVDVRVIAATNVDLQEKITAGEFRHDLYFRLARFPVVTPPLRDRREDIPLLVRHFLDLFATEMGMRPPEISAEALELLTSYAFPGNVRELKNILERALIESGGRIIKPSHLHLLELEVSKPSSHGLGSARPFHDLPLNVEAAEEALIQRALEQTRGNIAEAARILGVNRSRIYRKISREAKSRRRT